jgi:hypothetical protein
MKKKKSYIEWLKEEHPKEYGELLFLERKKRSKLKKVL